MVTTTQPDPAGQEAAFNDVSPRAAALAPALVRRRGDVQLALDNVNTGLAALESRSADLLAKWPAARVDALAGARELALAAVFASSRANQLDVREKDLTALISQMYAARDKTFAVMDMCATWELIPAERVGKIREGKGAIDGGQDLVDGMALLREYGAALQGKTPLTPAFLTDTEALGNRVVQELKKEGGRKDVNLTAKDAADLANRIWTLLCDAHSELRKAGFELWGDALDDHVPLLQSRVGGGRRAAPGKPS
ncbi:MAG: hypothetical protein HY904_04570 [Deltaproteobacteria bacterium]|nr:hypothetical protein [Deltaproteobacteria bacterium]